MKHFDVIVIGGGHAGCEAASAAARLGCRTALVTMKASDLGVMSCNPAIGGLGKGHLVREIDALDGLMGQAADRSGIQFRLLNRSKGPAVQGPRAQADRKIYRASITEAISRQENLTMIVGEVVKLVTSGDIVEGVELADGQVLKSATVVLTTGTFLRGKVHIGKVSYAAGRMGSDPSSVLAEQISDLGLASGRLKTGTPPRLDGRTIDWKRLDAQAGDEIPTFFSFLTREASARQVACGITHTNEVTHRIIEDNLDQSAMYGGMIDGTGPRYCPSIEDKIVRFPEKQSHQIFLEPEGLDDYTVYPNGISTSLPEGVQEQYVRSIYGLESVSISQPGYAIEYDYVDPRSLNSQLECSVLKRLYLAGQINGTTGYEEAAAQGLVAGLNAGLFARGLDPVKFSRVTSYIGVMIDDLVTRGVTEPYRMFTSRAEHRLSLRADNADQRLTPMAMRLGIVSVSRQESFERKMEKLSKARSIASEDTHSSTKLREVGVNVRHDGVKRTALELLAFSDITLESLFALVPTLTSVDDEILEQLKREAVYANYIPKEAERQASVLRDESVKLPTDVDYLNVPSISKELSVKLNKVRPESVGQAARIEGMTPAALTVLFALSKKKVG